MANLGESKRARGVDDAEQDDDVLDVERKGDPEVGWPAVWDDRNDDAINSHLDASDFRVVKKSKRGIVGRGGKRRFIV